MDRIADILRRGPTRSFEFFPPKTDEAAAALETAVVELAGLRPSFTSVTYGALGSTQERTREWVVRLNAEHPFPTMAHLTCVGHRRDEVVRLLDEYAASGVRNILALGGDPPADGTDPGGEFHYACELVELVREHPAGFSVGVAAHPECHPRSPDRESDRRHLAAKLRLADFGITQFFFEVEHYERMREELAALACHTPVIPGVMPIVGVAGVRRMAAMNGTEIPRDLWDRLDAVADQPAAVVDIGVEVAGELCERLVEAGAPGVHLYTLNRSGSVRRILGGPEPRASLAGRGAGRSVRRDGARARVRPPG